MLAAVLTAAPGLACAEAIVDQVERLDVERGETEWELQSLYAEAADGEPSEMMFNLSAEHGFTDRFALGFELESEREGAEGLQAGVLSLQGKFVALDPAEAPVGFGIQVSLGRALTGNETEAELRLLAEFSFRGPRARGRCDAGKRHHRR